MRRNAAVMARTMSAECGMVVQQLVPYASEMTSASSAAICSAITISPRADPAYPRFRASSPFPPDDGHPHLAPASSPTSPQ